MRRFEEVLESRRIKLQMELAPREIDTSLDEGAFQQALEAVVQNAIDAMPDGGELRVATTFDEAHAEVTVTDSGPGVDPKNEAEIFMPFFSTKERGMGLGLTVAHRIMNQHRGTVTLTKSADRGGSFSLSLPVSEKHHADHSRS